MHRRSLKAQAMVEFALALPIFLLVIIGLMEAARLLFMYASVASASREAVRYGSAWGVNDAGVDKYKDCPGILDTIDRVAFLLDRSTLDIVIAYDDGPVDAANPTSDLVASCNVSTEVFTLINSAREVTTGDRIIVTVTSPDYMPIVNLIPFSQRDISSGPAARTIMGKMDLNKP